MGNELQISLIQPAKPANMSLEDQLTEALIELYHRASKEVGYKGTRFLQAVRRKGGLATAKRMLKPRRPEQRAGLDKLLNADRPDLTMEAVILRPQFESLFSPEELNVAETRLGEYGKEAAQRRRLYPDELEDGHKYLEGRQKQVWVNAYERNPQARAICLKHYGFRCAVCDLLFEERYGDIGKGFIHVHHLKPLSLANGAYELNPVEDLRPVCPNCHAMLHRTDNILSVEELRTRIAVAEGTTPCKS